jgi:CRISPR type III-B/RAMP module RAMP protein Cmr1
MIPQKFRLDIITPCFCGGAEPDKQAEIRPASIRGQLRWWFRTLGGFKSLANQNLDLREQEDLLFGTAGSDSCRAGAVIVRVSGIEPSREVRDDEGLNAKPGTDRGYLLFPLRAEKKGRPEERRRDRGVFNPRALPNGPSFTLHILLRTHSEFQEDFIALVHIFGYLGSLGFRSRRAMGALAIREPRLSVPQALAKFSKPDALHIMSLSASDANDAICQLAHWLKSWRAHGRTGNNTTEQQYPGYKMAKSDHDAALGKNKCPGYRAVLGMPLITKYGTWNAEKPDKPGGTKGRFASPVLLRPHRDTQGKWHALVIFLDAHRWPVTKRVFLDGQPREVCLDLYEAMKRDPRLEAFL